jgi:hypothetical protein
MKISQKPAVSAQPDEVTLNFMREHGHVFFEAGSRWPLESEPAVKSPSADLILRFIRPLDQEEKSHVATDLSRLLANRNLKPLDALVGVFGDTGAFDEACRKGEQSTLIARFPVTHTEAVHIFGQSLNNASRQVYLERHPAKKAVMEGLRNIFGANSFGIPPLHSRFDRFG